MLEFSEGSVDALFVGLFSKTVVARKADYPGLLAAETWKVLERDSGRRQQA